MPRECVSSLSPPNITGVIRTNAGPVHVYACECDRQWSKADLARCGGLIPLHDELLLEDEIGQFVHVAHRFRDEAWWFEVPRQGAHRGSVRWDIGDGESLTAECSEVHGTIECAGALESACE